jgi:hypothetical protein
MNGVLKLLKDIPGAKYTPYILYAILTLAILWQLLLPGYVLFLDMVFGPRGVFSFENFIPPYPNNGLPYFLTVNSLSKLLPSWVIQKVIFFSIFFLAGVGAHRLCPARTAGKYFAGIFYMINPLVYARFLNGYLRFLVAYALVPFAVAAYIDWLEAPDKRRLGKAILWTACLGIFSLQVMVLTLALLAIIALCKLARQGLRSLESRQLIKGNIIYILVLITLNIYWIVPYFTSNQDITQMVGPDDLLAFAPHLIIINPVFSLATLHGFWREGYIYTKDLLPGWHLVFTIIMFLAAYGIISHHRNIYARAVILVGIICLVMGSGVAGPISGFYELLLEKVPLMAGFRDSQKFIVMLALAYSYLGGLGVSEFAGALERQRKKRHSAENQPLRRWQTGSLIVVICAAPLAPLILCFSIFGFYGQLQVSDYPREWYEVKDHLDQDRHCGSVLVFPWHLYMDYSWLPNVDKRLGSPFRYFLDQPVISGDNIEIGNIYSQSANPVSKYVELLLANRDNIGNLGELLAPLNVSHVILVEESDYDAYDFLYRQKDLKIAIQKQGITVFANAHPSSRVYGTDKATFLRKAEDIIHLSQTQDIMESLYIIGEDTGDTGENGFTPIDYAEKGRWKYQVAGSEEKWMVFTLTQDLSAGDWKYNGQSPRAYNIGFIPVFLSDPDGGTVINTRFYHVYLPSYFFSLVALMSLVLLTYLPPRNK